MKPEAEWFRKPTWVDAPSCGDTSAFFIVAEPERGEVYGVYYEVSMECIFVTPSRVMAMVHKAAEGELRRRIADGEKHGEGERFEAFRWNPIIVRDMLGRVTIRTDREYTLVEPGFVPTEPRVVVKAHNLFSRPGRTFSVKGEDVSTEMGPRSGT